MTLRSTSDSGMQHTRSQKLNVRVNGGDNTWWPTPEGDKNASNICIKWFIYFFKSLLQNCVSWPQLSGLVKYCRLYRLFGVFVVNLRGRQHLLLYCVISIGLTKPYMQEGRKERDGKIEWWLEDVLRLKRVYWSSLHDGLRGGLSLWQSKTNGASDGQLCSWADQLERAQQQDKNKK